MADVVFSMTSVDPLLDNTKRSFCAWILLDMITHRPVERVPLQGFFKSAKTLCQVLFTYEAGHSKV